MSGEKEIIKVSVLHLDHDMKDFSVKWDIQIPDFKQKVADWLRCKAEQVVLMLQGRLFDEDGSIYTSLIRDGTVLTTVIDSDFSIASIQFPAISRRPPYITDWKDDPARTTDKPGETAKEKKRRYAKFRRYQEYRKDKGLGFGGIQDFGMKEIGRIGGGMDMFSAGEFGSFGGMRGFGSGGYNTRPIVQPNKDLVDKFVKMGYEEVKVREALIHNNNGFDNTLIELNTGKTPEPLGSLDTRFAKLKNHIALNPEAFKEVYAELMTKEEIRVAETSQPGLIENLLIPKKHLAASAREPARPAPPAAPPQPTEAEIAAAIASLVELGFTPEQAKEAYLSCGRDVNAAAEKLMQ